MFFGFFWLQTVLLVPRIHTRAINEGVNHAAPSLPMMSLCDDVALSTFSYDPRMQFWATFPLWLLYGGLTRAQFSLCRAWIYLWSLSGISKCHRWMRQKLCYIYIQPLAPKARPLPHVMMITSLLRNKEFWVISQLYAVCLPRWPR